MDTTGTMELEGTAEGSETVVAEEEGAETVVAEEDDAVPVMSQNTVDAKPPVDAFGNEASSRGHTARKTGRSDLKKVSKGPASSAAPATPAVGATKPAGKAQAIPKLKKKSFSVQLDRAGGSLGLGLDSSNYVTVVHPGKAAVRAPRLEPVSHFVSGVLCGHLVRAVPLRSMSC